MYIGLIPCAALLVGVWDLLSIRLWKSQKQKAIKNGQTIFFGKKEAKFLASIRVQFLSDVLWQFAFLIGLMAIGQFKEAGVLLILFVLEFVLQVQIVILGMHGAEVFLSCYWYS